MAFFNVRRDAFVRPDRRIAKRYLVDCPARLVSAGGGRDGKLSDLSEHGARLDTAVPPPPGTSGFLRWDDQDHYCKVIWSNDTRCGLRFERPIAAAVVEATCSHFEIALKPVAALDRIPIGQRRCRHTTSGLTAEA